MGLWARGPVRVRWLPDSGSVARKLVGLWACASLRVWWRPESGSVAWKFVGPWARGPAGPWARGRVGPLRARGPVGPWTRGPVGVDGGPVRQWACGAWPWARGGPVGAQRTIPDKGATHDATNLLTRMRFTASHP